MKKLLLVGILALMLSACSDVQLAPPDLTPQVQCLTENTTPPTQCDWPITLPPGVPSIPLEDAEWDFIQTSNRTIMLSVDSVNDVIAEGAEMKCNGLAFVMTHDTDELLGLLQTRNFTKDDVIEGGASCAIEGLWIRAEGRWLEVSEVGFNAFFEMWMPIYDNQPGLRSEGLEKPIDPDDVQHQKGEKSVSK